MFSLSWKELSVGVFVCLMGLSIWSVKGIWSDTKTTSIVEDDSYDMFGSGRVTQSDQFRPNQDNSPPQKSTRHFRKSRTQEQTQQLGTDTQSVPSPTAVAAVPVPVPVKPADAKDAKKKADEAKKKKDKAVAVAKAKAKAAEQKARMLVQNPNAGVKPIPPQAEQDYTPPDNNAQVAGFMPNTPAPVATDNSKDDEEDAKLSPGQWFSLLQAQPTPANAAKFRAAKSQVGDKDYYEIISKLLVDSQPDRQKLALSLLQRDYSISTFQFLVKPPPQVQANEQIMTSLAGMVKSYNSDRSRFSILAAALNSKDQTVVSVSQGLILEALRRQTPIDTGVQIGTSTSAIPRGTVVSYKANDFLVFKPGLGRLMTSQVPDIAQRAKEIYTSLWKDAPGSQQTASTSPQN